MKAEEVGKHMDGTKHGHMYLYHSHIIECVGEYFRCRVFTFLHSVMFLDADLFFPPVC